MDKTKPDAFATIRAARALRERHPDAPPSVTQVALVMATFANGRTGTSIRPGYERMAELTGRHPDTVRRAIYWLIKRGELRRDNRAHPGTAACFTWLGGMVGPDTVNGGASRPTHQPSQPTPQGPSAPSGGQPDGTTTCADCGGPLGYLAPGEQAGEGAMCLDCFRTWSAR